MIGQEIVSFSCVGQSGHIICRPAIRNDSSAIVRFFELGLVLVRFDHVASFIVNANHSVV